MDMPKLATFVVKRAAGKKASPSVSSIASSPLICVTGFSGGYLPDKKDFFQIFAKALRADIIGKTIKMPRVNGEADDVFAEYRAYPINSNEGEVVFRLKEEHASLLKSLPVARNLEDTTMHSQNEVLRTAWCGALVPVKHGKILNLTRQYRNRLKDSKEWNWVRWYSLVFRTFQPNALAVDSTSDVLVKTVLAKCEPDLHVDRLHGEEAKRFRVRGSRGVLIKCDSAEDVFAVREILFGAGLLSRPAEREKFDLHDAFLHSEYRRIEEPVDVQDEVESQVEAENIAIESESSQEDILEVDEEEETSSELPLLEVRDLRDEDLFVTSKVPPQDEVSLEMEDDDDYYVVQDRGIMFASRRERMTRRLQGISMNQEVQERAFS